MAMVMKGFAGVLNKAPTGAVGVCFGKHDRNDLMPFNLL